MRATGPRGGRARISQRIATQGDYSLPEPLVQLLGDGTLLGTIECHDSESPFGDLVQLAVDVNVGLVELTSVEVYLFGDDSNHIFLDTTFVPNEDTVADMMTIWYESGLGPLFEPTSWRTASGESRVAGRDGTGRFLSHPALEDWEGDDDRDDEDGGPEVDPQIPSPLRAS